MIRDVNFYKFLKDAIVNKYRNANALDFRTIEYDPWIYKWARDTFRELKTPEFLNIQNRDVLERLYERLHIDPRLKPLDDPDLALGNKDYELSENFHQKHEADRLLAQQKVTAAAGPVPGGESAGTMASKGGQPISSSHPPVIHNIPQVSPTGISQSLTRQVPIPEEGPATAAKPDLKFKPGFTNTLRNFGSKAGRRIASVAKAGLETANPFLKRAGIGLLNGLESIARPGGMGRMGGGSRSIFGRFGKFGGGGRSGSLISKAKSRTGLMFFIGVLGFMMLLGGLVILGANQTGTTPGGNVGVGTATPSAGIQPVPVTHPTAPTVDPSGYKQKIIDLFGITMNEYDEQHLKWAWEKLWDVSNTNFPKYIKGVTITKSGDTRKVNCSNLQIGHYDNEELFKLIFTHEFGHIIQDCDQGLPRQLAEHQNAFAKEGGVTYYANHAVACGSYDNIQEDYADMIARYLNPNSTIQMVRGNPADGCTPPVTENVNLKTNFPKHYNAVKTILGNY